MQWQCIQAHDRVHLATLVHEMWFAWHAARWTCSLIRLGPGSDDGRAEPALAAQEGAVRSRLVAAILDGGKQASLSTTAVKALQLRLAARHVSRCSLSLFVVGRIFDVHGLAASLSVVGRILDVHGLAELGWVSVCSLCDIATVNASSLDYCDTVCVQIC